METSSRRQRGLKRRRTPEKFEGRKNSKKSAEQRVVERIYPEVGGDSHMGEEEDVSDNVVVHKETSVYDNLLMRLGSDNKVLSDAYKRRLRSEEGESDAEEDEDGHSFDNTNHDYLNEGTEEESAGEEAGTPVEINRIDNDSAESEETDAEDGRESPDSEEEYQMEASSSVTGHSVSLSSFSSHLGHTLSNEEINKVLEKRRKYNWEVSTVDMPNCKWIGTGKCLKIPVCGFENRVKLVCEYKGTLSKVLLQVRQVYERFAADSIESADDARLQYFQKRSSPRSKILYRLWFFEGTRKVLLYTERAHFYHRYKIRGIKNLIIYSLPERKEFYPEIVNLLEGSQEMTCSVLFSRFDLLRLERIVSSALAKRLVTSDESVFVFC